MHPKATGTQGARTPQAFQELPSDAQALQAIEELINLAKCGLKLIFPGGGGRDGLNGGFGLSKDSTKFTLRT